jgi:hypothetical protein
MLAVLVHPLDVPVTVNVVVTKGFTLANPAELFGVDSTYWAGDQEYEVAPLATKYAVSPIAIFEFEPETCVCGPWVTVIRIDVVGLVTDPDVASRR